jgi:hypothetical protein
MIHSIEATMQEQLWSWLARRGYEVYGEVRLSDGRVDIVYVNADENEYVGVELKNHGGDAQRIYHPAVDESELENRPAEPSFLANKYCRQLNKYVESGELDRIYFACQDPSILTAATKHSVDYLGQIRVPDPFHSDGLIDVISKAGQIDREQIPSLRRDDEPTTQHYIWEEIGGIREAVLPNREVGKTKRIDILQFTDEIDPTEVYRNQGSQDIIGIEVKGAISTRSEPEDIQEQLRIYLNSGGVTRLYLGVPVVVRDEALELLDSASGSELDSVGLYTVSNDGEVTKEREADKQPIYFDGMRVNTGSTHDYVIDIGWGKVNPALPEKSEQDYFSIFDTM